MSITIRNSSGDLDREITFSDGIYRVASRHSGYLDFLQAFAHSLNKQAGLTTAEMESGLFVFAPNVTPVEKISALEGVDAEGPSPASNSLLSRSMDGMYASANRLRKRVFGPNKEELRTTFRAVTRMLYAETNPNFDVPDSVWAPSERIWTSSPLVYHPDGVVGVSHDFDVNNEFYWRMKDEFSVQHSEWRLPFSHDLAKGLIAAVERNEGFTSAPAKGSSRSLSYADRSGGHNDPLFRRIRGKYAEQFWTKVSTQGADSVHARQNYGFHRLEVPSLEDIEWRDENERKTDYHSHVPTGTYSRMAIKDCLLIMPIALDVHSTSAWSNLGSYRARPAKKV